MNRHKQLFAIALTICILLMPTAAFAAELPCPHHPPHTLECGFAAAVAETPCEHLQENGYSCGAEDCAHDDDCGYLAEAPEQPCKFDPATCPVCYPKDSGKIVTITAFAGLADEIRWQRTLAPVLPETLTATAGDGEILVPVTWSAEGFDPANLAHGKRFTLLPTLDAAYAVAEGVRLPQITLVTPPKGRMVGEGTENNPLQITSAEQLGEIRDQVNKGVLESITFGTTSATVYLKLMTDIDLGGEEWEPIGIDGKEFKSHFDGGGHKITGLKINTIGENQGLFGVVTGTVENLAVLGVDITGTDSRVGGVVGLLGWGTVKNCYTSGSVNGGGSIGTFIGGVVGTVDNSGTVENCYSTASVSGNGSIGGVVGLLYDGTVKNCAGLNPKVTGSSGGVGRVVGANTGGSIENCYAFAGMTGGTFTDKTVDGVNGADLDLTGNTLDTLFTGGHWKNASGKLPGFGAAVELPVYMQDASSTTILISTPDELRNLAINVNNGTNDGNGKTYKLTADLDLSGYANWEPIGSASYPFQGSFDGDGHKIRGLTITRSTEDFIGLFGYLNRPDVIVKNLGLVGVNITGKDYVGGVAGNFEGTMENCYVTGSVNGTNQVGGVLGMNNATIQNCYSTASVSGTNEVGGVVGNNTETAKNCYSTASVSATGDYAGGVVGYTINGRVKNCAALGASVSGGSDVGRVAGKTGSATLSGNYAFSGMTVNNSTVTGDDGTGTSGKSITAEQIAAGTILNGLFTDSRWKKEAGKLPGFGAAEDLPGHLLGAAPFPLVGGVYQISTPAQLQKLATLVNGGESQQYKSFQLQNDLDLSGINWTPIGNWNYFKGTFDGNGYKITGLFIDNNALTEAGLFGNVVGGTIRNLGIEGANINGAAQIGGVAGFLGKSGTIERCYVTGRIEGKNSTGGIVGNAVSSNLNNCYATASVGGEDKVGGVVGEFSNNSGGSMTNCYASGSVTGNGDIGGVVGYLVAGTVKNCAALNPSISGTGTNIGRVVGSKYSGTTTNNYAFSGIAGSFLSGADNGTNLSTGDALSPAFWKDANKWETLWSDSIWTFSATGDNLPILKGFKGAQSGDSGFYLTRRSIAESTVTVTVDPSDYTKIPTVKVEFGTTVLVKDKDYTVTTSNVGQYTVTVTGIGEYIGTQEKKFGTTTKQLTWGKPGTVNSKRYDGTKTATVLTAPTLSGVAAGDDVTVTCTVEFTSSSVGESIPIKVTGWSLTGTAAGNYIKPATDPTFENGRITASAPASSTLITIPSGSTSNGSDSSDSDTRTAFEKKVDNLITSIKVARPGTKLKLDMSRNPILPKEILNALAGKKVTLTLNMGGGVKWVIRGTDLDGNDYGSLNLGVNAKAKKIPVSVINKVTGEVKIMQLALTHNGAFGFSLTMQLETGKKNAGLWAHLYYYNPKTKALEYRTSGLISASGKVDLPFSTASDYAVVIDKRNLIG